MLSQELSNPYFTILTDRPARTRHFFPTVHTQYRWDFFGVAKTMRKADVVIWGGGHLIQNMSSQAFMLFQLSLVNLALLQGIPVVGFALGAGDLKGSIWRRMTKATLNRLSAITVRDTASRQLLQDLGVQRPILVSADPALVLRSDESRATELQEEADSPYAVIAPRRWFHYRHSFLPVKWQNAAHRKASPKFNATLDGLARLADWLAEAHDLNLLFIPMYPGAEQGDELVSEAIRERMRYSSRAQILRRDYRPEDLVGVIGQSQVVLGVRLHSAILATCATVPAFHLFYQDKGLSFFDQIDMREFSMPVDKADWTQVEVLLQRLIEQRDFYSERLTRKREELALAARQSARVVRRVLQGLPVNED